MLERIKKIPAWGWLSGFGFLLMNYLLYRLAYILSIRTGTISHAVTTKIDLLDGAMPVTAGFVIVYLFSYVFWVVGVAMISLTRKSNAFNALLGLGMAYLIGFLILLLCPTYMDRGAEGILQMSESTKLCEKLLGRVYLEDGGNMAYNLFPSFHCLASVYCALAVHRRKEIPAFYRIYAFVMSVMICVSVLLTKQHYLLDVVGGAAVAVFCYCTVMLWNPGKYLFAKLKSRGKQRA